MVNSGIMIETHKVQGFVFDLKQQRVFMLSRVMFRAAGSTCAICFAFLMSFSGHT